MTVNVHLQPQNSLGCSWFSMATFMQNLGYFLTCLEKIDLKHLPYFSGYNMPFLPKLVREK